ncbi:MAG: hypothetical protein WAU57_05610 [Xanthobacteraceae bacterium]
MVDMKVERPADAAIDAQQQGSRDVNKAGNPDLMGLIAAGRRGDVAAIGTIAQAAANEVPPRQSVKETPQRRL